MTTQPILAPSAFAAKWRGLRRWPELHALAGLLLIVTITTGCSWTLVWSMQPFTSDSGRFSVIAGAEGMQLVVDHPQKSPLRGRVVYYFRGELPDGTRLAVTYADDPRGAPSSSDAAALIEDVIRFDNVGMKFVEDHSVTQHGIAGREVRTACCGTTVAVFRAFVVGARFYMVAMSGPENLIDGPAQRLFLESFSIFMPKDSAPYS